MRSGKHSQTLRGLETWEQIVSERESEFIARFCPTADIIGGVYWSYYQMKLVYMVHSGQWVTDSVPMQDWQDFILCGAEAVAELPCIGLDDYELSVSVKEETEEANTNNNNGDK